MALAIVTPLLEKNVLKTLALDTPVVFSMSRVILLAFACAMLRQIWRAGIAGWPEASLSIAIVLALPVLGALDKVKPTDVLELAKVLIARFGEGGVRRVATVYTPDTEPSKYDDHRSDTTDPTDTTGSPGDT
ncbi:MAG: hypothetical protein ABI205_08255 [Gemmatimonadaceae bacterium]